VLTVKDPDQKKEIKAIKVNVDKCTGCRSCELACSAFHAVPRYSSLNPARSRIRVFVDEINDVYVPIRGGNYAQAECSGRNRYKINAKEYSECAFCPAACPSRDWFKEPDSGLPLQCDMCEDTPPLTEPMCVQACKFDALIYEVREEEGAEEKVQREEIEIGLEELTDRFGLQKVKDIVSRMSRKG
jgi:benzoyl-CoA reductase subunit BamC